MAKEESLNKSLYKILVYAIRVIPMVMSFITLLNLILAYFGYDLPILSYIAGNSVLTLVFLYLTSYVFRFCEYHRMFIHYNTLIWLINIYDLYTGIPVSDFVMLWIYLIMSGISLFIILYLYRKC